MGGRRRTRRPWALVVACAIGVAVGLPAPRARAAGGTPNVGPRGRGSEDFAAARRWLGACMA